jgi:hypothetical protein
MQRTRLNVKLPYNNIPRSPTAGNPKLGTMPTADPTIISSPDQCAKSPIIQQKSLKEELMSTLMGRRKDESRQGQKREKETETEM